MSNISLDTEGERWMWGGIIGGSSIVFVAISLAIRKIHKSFSRKKEIKKILLSLYADDEKVTHAKSNGVDEEARLAPSVPVYDKLL